MSTKTMVVIGSRPIISPARVIAASRLMRLAKSLMMAVSFLPCRPKAMMIANPQPATSAVPF